VDRLVTERLLVALWRAARVSPGALAAGIVEQWAPEALAGAGVESCTVSLAEADQGLYAQPADADGLVPNCDALVALGLTRAHDLDDVPARDVLHELVRRMEVWRVDRHRPLVWDRDWPDGEFAPGVKMVSFMVRAEGLGHEQFARHWREQHTPLALQHHVGLWNYTQNVVRRSFTPGGGGFDGVAELYFRTRTDFVDRFFDSESGRAVIMDDVRRFMARPRPETAVMRELPLRTEEGS
jgi:uncharacterized protein (TIGR02118 family)